MIAGAAAGRVRRSPTRSDREELDDLVLHLGQIWQRYTGKPFSQTRKGHQTPRDFVKAVFASLRITESDRRIDSSMRAAVTALRQD
jgi:hypothetical protein